MGQNRLLPHCAPLAFEETHCLIMVDQIVALLTLLALEIVLGIDNVIFIAILSAKLPEVDRAKARRLGIGLAVVTRILLLLSLSWVLGLWHPLFLSHVGFNVCFCGYETFHGVLLFRKCLMMDSARCEVNREMYLRVHAAGK